MLHIFWIHSHITYLISREIILTINDDEEIIIFLSRRYELPNIADFQTKKIKVIEFPWYRDNIRLYPNILYKKNILQTRKNVKQCLSFFNKNINNKPFILYIPTSWEYSITLMMHHPKCNSYYYIEEGTLAYLENGHKERTSVLRTLFIKIIYNLHYLGMYGILDNFKGSYALSEKAFPWHSKEKKIVKWSKKDGYYKELFCFDKIIIFDYLNFSIEELHKFLTQLKYFLQDNNITDFIFKFHPATKGYASEDIVRSYLKQFNIKEADPGFIVELFVMNHPLNIYCVNSISSISKYAANTGSNCFFIKYDKEKNKLNMLDISDNG